MIFLDQDLFARAQQARAANRINRDSVGISRRTYALSGLAVCGYCGGKMHMQTRSNGRVRLQCYRLSQGLRCEQRSSYVDPIETQIGDYLRRFQLPDELIEEIIALCERADDQHHDAEREQAELSGRLERIKDMYRWGDLTREAYQAERDRLETQLAGVKGASERSDLLRQAATFLRDLPVAWAVADSAHRNTLGRLVFQQVEIKDGRASAVVVQPDFAPFFVALADGDDADEAAGGDDDPEENNNSEAIGLGVSNLRGNGRKRRAFLRQRPNS